MMDQILVIVTGLALAAWGHLLVHDLLGAGQAWSRVDGLFPANLQSTPSFAGYTMLIMGALLVLIPIAA
jgi:hypothetical protein